MILFSKLGLILIGLQLLLTALIPVFTKIFDQSCSIICIFSEEQGYFILFNIPGLYIASIPFMHEFIKNLGAEQQRLSGEITLISNILIFILSAIIYYIIGLGIETIWRKKLSQMNKKKAFIMLILGVFVSLILFIVLAELFMNITSKIGQKVEQFQRCKDKNGFNTYEWEIFKYEFYCKNGQYDGAYKVYKDGIPDVEYTYKKGKMICETQYSCGKDFK